VAHTTRGRQLSPDGLDLLALEGYLTAELGGLHGPLQAELVSGGKSNLTFRVTDGTSRWIVRRPPLGDVPPGAHDVGREFRVMAALHGSRVPVPRARALCTTPAVLGAPFYVMDEVAGQVLRTSDQVAAVEPDMRRALGERLVDLLADLHDIEPDAVGLADLGRPEGYLRRQLQRWTRQYHAIEVRDLPQVDAIAAVLGASLPDSPAGAVVHGDFRLDNVIVHGTDASRVEAVLDWEMATLGDPLADLGTFLMFWDEPGQAPNPISAGLTAHAGFPTREEVLARYLARRRLQVQDLDWYLAFARFRLAVILEQIHARHVAGRTRGQGFDGVGDMVISLLAETEHALT
jgi:aminoglycoside phosphotransferase (APT) family kinase protein